MSVEGKYTNVWSEITNMAGWKGRRSERKASGSKFHTAKMSELQSSKDPHPSPLPLDPYVKHALTYLASLVDPVFILIIPEQAVGGKHSYKVAFSAIWVERVALKVLISRFDSILVFRSRGRLGWWRGNDHTWSLHSPMRPSASQWKVSPFTRSGWRAWWRMNPFLFSWFFVVNSWIAQEKTKRLRLIKAILLLIAMLGFLLSLHWAASFFQASLRYVAFSN